VNMSGRLLGFVILSGVLVACASSPTGRSQFIAISDTQLNQMGAASFSKLKSKQRISGNQTANARVQCVSNHILRAMGQNPSAWEVVVFDDKQINAFATPGNKIGVYTGMLAFVDNDDQLAAVIGHEVGHVIARHSNERASMSMVSDIGLQVAGSVAGQYGVDPNMVGSLGGMGLQYGVMLPFSRTHETEADIIGIDLMAKAGFRPEESIRLWQKMAASGQSRPPELLSTHPSPGSRIQDLRNRLPNAQAIYQRSQKTRCY
jgi:predicted Zn-dependent protease